VSRRLIQNRMALDKQQSQYLSDSHRNYHESQFTQPKRSTVALCRFMQETLEETPRSAVDVACGAGANIYYFSQFFPGCKWTGLDFADIFYNRIGRQYLAPDMIFVQGDLFKLTEIFPEKAFDMSLSIQTLSWLPRYEAALQQLMGVTKKWVFITSLFSDFRVDCITKVHTYDENGAERSDSPYFYNIYSLELFSRFALANGARQIISKDFVIDIDLPLPKNGEMGTYTVGRFDGTRLQFSGPLAMPWKMIALRLF